MTTTKPTRYSIVFDRLSPSAGAETSAILSLMKVDADIRELVEASAALRSPDKPTYTAS